MSINSGNVVIDAGAITSGTKNVAIGGSKGLAIGDGARAYTGKPNGVSFIVSTVDGKKVRIRQRTKDGWTYYDGIEK